MHISCANDILVVRTSDLSSSNINNSLRYTSFCQRSKWIKDRYNWPITGKETNLKLRVDLESLRDASHQPPAQVLVIIDFAPFFFYDSSKVFLGQWLSCLDSHVENSPEILNWPNIKTFEETSLQLWYWVKFLYLEFINENGRMTWNQSLVTNGSEEHQVLVKFFLGIVEKIPK